MSEILKPQRPLNVFLCHSSSDKRAVRELYKHLRADGIEAWLDEENLIPGQNWQSEIQRAVRSSDAVIVCLSQHSISKAGYVQKEIVYALDMADEQPENTIFLIPLKLEECEVPRRLSHLQWVDLFEQNGYEKLKRALENRANSLNRNYQNMLEKTAESWELGIIRDGLEQDLERLKDAVQDSQRTFRNKSEEFQLIAGELLEEEVQKIFSESNFLVYQPKSYVGKISERVHEFDVSAEFDIDSYHVLSVVRCFCSDNPIDIGTVIEFAERVEDIQAQQGIIITTSIFQEEAKRLAIEKGITCVRVTGSAWHYYEESPDLAWEPKVQDHDSIQPKPIMTRESRFLMNLRRYFSDLFNQNVEGLLESDIGLEIGGYFRKLRETFDDFIGHSDFEGYFPFPSGASRFIAGKGIDPFKGWEVLKKKPPCRYIFDRKAGLYLNTRYQFYSITESIQLNARPQNFWLVIMMKSKLQLAMKKM